MNWGFLNVYKKDLKEFAETTTKPFTSFFKNNILKTENNILKTENNSNREESKGDDNSKVIKFSIITEEEEKIATDLNLPSYEEFFKNFNIEDEILKRNEELKLNYSENVKKEEDKKGYFCRYYYRLLIKNEKEKNLNSLKEEESLDWDEEKEEEEEEDKKKNILKSEFEDYLNELLKNKKDEETYTIKQLKQFFFKKCNFKIEEDIKKEDNKDSNTEQKNDNNESPKKSIENEKENEKENENENDDENYDEWE